MMTKGLFVLVAVGGLTGAGLSFATTRGSCCAPGADCCYPGSPCCESDCCAAGSSCCVPGAPCCELSEGGKALFTASRQPVQPAASEPATTKIAVDGMTCAGCAKTVGKAVSAVAGVESATADVKTKSLTVVAKKGAAPSPKALWEAVEKAGYTPTRIEGAAGTFDKKPTK